MSEKYENKEDYNRNSEEEENKESKYSKELEEKEINNNIITTEEKDETERKPENSDNKEEKQEKEEKNEEIQQEKIVTEEDNNMKNDNDENTQNIEEKENNIENNNEIKMNENENNKDNNDIQEKKETEIEEEIIDPEIKKMQENLKPVYEKIKSLLDKLKELINILQKEIQDNNNKRQNYTKLLNDITKEIKSENEIKKSIDEDMKNLEIIITNKIKQMSENKKMKKGRHTVERSKKELFLYKSSEDLINIKQKQLKNVSKLNTILDKDISKINSSLKKGFYIKKDIQEENPEIKTKSDELNYIYNKLNSDISAIKKEIHLLKNVKDAHNKCDKQIIKLNKELETLKQRKDVNVVYSEIKAKNKEMNEIKRQQIVANKALESTKFKLLLKSSEKSNYSLKKNKDTNFLHRIKNHFFITNTTKHINNTNIIYFEKKTNDDKNNVNDTRDKTYDKSLEEEYKKYKSLLQLKIDEKNRNQRKINSEIEEMNKERMKKEEELNGKELKKINVQKSNYDLENLLKLNAAKIKKLNKQLDELKIKEDDYDKQIIKKELALKKLKIIVDSVNNMQKLRE